MMIKILGCFKVVPNLELLAEEDWQPDGENQIDTSYVKTNWNCFDEGALEMMLKLSDLSESFGFNFQLDALTVGGKICDNYLKTLYALGFEEAVRIECEEDLRYWPELTAGLITEYVSQIGGQKIIMMGRQSEDDDNGKTPFLAAEMLGWPCFTQVVAVQPLDERHLAVTHMIDGGICQQKVTFPCVLSIGDVPGGYLRVPTLKDRMQKGKRPIKLYTQEELQVDSKEWEAKTMLKALTPITAKRAGTIIAGGLMEEKVNLLYQSYLKDRLEKL